MQQSRPPDANSKHRDVLQVSGGVNVPVWKALLIIIIQIIYTFQILLDFSPIVFI